MVAKMSAQHRNQMETDVRTFSGSSELRAAARARARERKRKTSRLQQTRGGLPAGRCRETRRRR
jgi:hypothetical protein